MAIQPKIITFQRRKYTLVQPHKEIGNGISEGPFYKRRGVDPQDWMFLPDAAYLLGTTDVPSFMYVIQQRRNVETERPD